MKKQLCVMLIGAFISGHTMAQEELPTVWEGKFDNRATVLSVSNSDGSMIMGTDEDQCTLLDESAKVLWSTKYKELTNKEGVKTAEIQNVYWGANLLFLFDKKIGKDKITVVDIKKGAAMWTTDQYQDLTEENIEYIEDLDAFFFSLKNSTVLINARTGEKIWETDKFKGSIGGYMYFSDAKELLMVNYKPTGLAALFSGFKNQLVRINAKTGEIIWNTTFKGFVEKEAVTRRSLVKLFVKGDKVFLQLDGLQVFDYKNGQPIWSAVYETDEQAKTGFFNRGPHGGRVVKGGIYHAIADPLFTDKEVYLVLGSNKIKNKFIAKYDVETGNKIWESEKITKADALPHIHLNNGKLICQIGGLVNQQTVENKTESGPSGSVNVTYYNNEWIFLGSYGIMALDPATGKIAWRSEKFDKRISNLVFGDGIVFAGSGDEFYGFDVQSGEMKINVDHAKGKVGKTMWAFDNGDNVVSRMIMVWLHTARKDGSKVYNTDKFRGVTSFHQVGNRFFLRKETNSSNTIAAVDLKTGEIIGTLKSKGKGGGGEFGEGLDFITDVAKFVSLSAEECGEASR
ncbi:MAG: PQQ-binding-like beta-propeller repeat protein [Bacteroidetes bacterium]|nr:PQQ-binding-like beta-propeller repeat protein [Bacteroidota bacterium]